MKKIFTPLLGKGLNIFIKGKPADELYANIDKDLKNLKTTKEKVDQLKKLVEQSESTINSNDFSKQDSDAIKSILDELKEMEVSKLQSQAKDLAKKIREYRDNNKD